MTVPSPRRENAITATAFLPAALEPLLALWQEAMPGDAPDAARFRDIVLLNPAFRPAGLSLLWRGTRLIGFGYAIAEPPAAPTGTPRGWVAGLGVAPGERGAGHGTRLLRSSLRFLADSGCSAAELGGNGERYLLPGLDPVAYPAFRGLIQRAGFSRTGSTEAMECDLRQAKLDPGAMADEQYHYQHPGDGDIPELLSLVAEFSMSWTGLVRGYLARSHDGANLWVARGQNGIAGFAGADLFPGCRGRFGPIGVTPAARGHGVGNRLLRLSLASMAERGRRSAWFLWGPAGTAGRRMYASAGFRVSRQFEFFRRDLPGVSGQAGR
jgi:ribosomal protein S18 acetylase RimI-like enzyme